MPKAFLNHTTKEKQIVKDVNDYLKSCLINTWLDEEKIHPGKKLLDEIYDGISAGGFFVAFISARYLKSTWCLRELSNAQLNDDKLEIIPVLMEKKEVIEKNVSQEEWRKVAPLLKSTNYIELNKYDLEETAKRISKAIWSDYPVRFSAIRKLSLGDIEAQLIHYETGEVPLDLLKNWDFNMEEFISRDNGADGNPILDMPIVLYGTSINWLITNLTISFYNKRDVLLYNQRDKRVICSYTTSPNSRLTPGDVFEKTIVI